MEKVFSYRIVKIGGKAVSVALTAFGLIVGGAQAAEVYLGSSLGQTAPNDGGTATSGIWLPSDQWSASNPSPSYSVSTSRSGDIFYSNALIFSGTGTANPGVNGGAYTVYPWGSNPVTGWMNLLWDDNPTASIDAQRSGTLILNTFGSIVDPAANNYVFGSGVTVGNVSRGSKAYATGSYWTDGGDATGGNGHWSIAVYAGTAAGTPTAYAIDVNGAVTFDGNATVNGAANAQSFSISGNNSFFNGAVTAPNAVNVNGNDNVFNGTVSADQVNLTGNNTSFAGHVTVANGLNFLNGVTASMTNGADISGDVNIGGHEATLRLSNGSNITGDVTTANGVSGTLVFEGNSTLNGHIGNANARLREIEVNGSSSDTVTLMGMNYVNLVNIQAGGNLVIGDGQNTDGLDTTGTVGGRVDFNNTDGTVTLTNTGTIRGQIVSTGGDNGSTATVANEVNFSQNGTMVGNIGSSASNRIGAVNVGSAAAGTVGMTGDLYATQLNISSSSTLNIEGDVTAATTLGNTGINGSATLAVDQGNVTGAVNTANNGQGIFSLVGGTQTVTGQIGASGMSLAAVNAGANTSNATLIGDVFATNLNVTGTGTVNLNGDFTGTAIRYLADGTVNLADGKTVTGAISNDTGTGSNGTFTFVQNGTLNGDIGASYATSLKRVNIGEVAGTNAGTVTTDSIWATTIAINNDSTLNVRRDEIIVGSVTTETHNTGTLTMLGNNSINGTVGANGQSMKLVNVSDVAGTAGAVFTNSIWASTIAINNGSTLAVRSGENITGNVTTETHNTGTLTMAAGTQSITGAVGASGASLNLVNVGEVVGSVAGALTTDSIWATTTAINNGSTLHVRSGHSITGNVTSETLNTGTLTLQGGAQSVTGTVGNGARLATVNAGTNGATSTFGNNVFATQLNVSGTGTVNLNGNFTGTTIHYQAAGTQGTVNLVNTGTSIASAITTATNNTGTLSLQAGTQTVTGLVGTNAARLATVNAGANSATSNFSSDVFATQLNVTGTGNVNLNGHFTGTAIHYQGDGTVNVNTARNINAAVTTATDNTGTLNMVGGAQAVSGNVGAAGARLATVNTVTNGASTTFNGTVHATTVNAGADSATTTFNDMVNVTTLNYSGNGTVILNGTNGASATAGLVGTVDFAAGTGQLQIGDNVNLTTGAAGIQFANANDATLTFNGSSTVTGVLGAAATGNTLASSTLGSIFAGAAGETVTFRNDVHVRGSTFHVSDTGTVNLQGDLYGPLVFDADGTVNVSNGKSIRNDARAATGTVTTASDGSGTLNYLGNTTLSNDLGTAVAALKAVNFHSDGTVAAVAQTLDKNIYADTTTIGNTTTGTTANITANVRLGDALTLAAANVTVNTAQQDVAQVGAGSRIAGANPNTLTFAHTALADGRLSTTATVTNATTGAGAITTNGATLNFSVAAQPWAANAGGALNTAAASSISGGTGSTLVMNGNEKVNIALLGSLKNNEAHTLINVGTASTAQTGTATDNSYVIDSVLSRNASGDLVATFRRDAQSYVTKSATSAHASQAAATRLGALAAAGASYSADMQQVINKLDLDQWGYGNNQANLATQVKRLAPISNGSITLSAMDAGALALNTMGNRMASLRADNALVGVAGAEAEGRDGQWIKLVGNSSRQQANGHYDGYSARTSGLVWGTDTRLNPDTLLGLGLSATNTSVDQRDFRAGQGHTIRSYELAGYGAYQFNANVYGEASLSYANHNITGSRLTALDRTTRADYDANQITARVGLGYRHVLAEKQTLTPMVNLESSRLRTDAYNETGADALNLKFNAQTVTRNRASLGLRYLSENTTDAGTVFRPELTAEVYRDNKGLSHNTTAAFAGDLTGATFTTTGVQNDRTGYKLAAGLSILNSKTSLVQLHYGYEHRDGFASHSARIKARWDF